MTKQTEALRMAIEAFDMYGNTMNSAFTDKAYQACKDALEQPTADKPTSREWVGLSDDELEELSSEEELMFWGFARSVEAKLKEKNEK